MFLRIKNFYSKNFHLNLGVKIFEINVIFEYFKIARLIDKANPITIRL